MLFFAIRVPCQIWQAAELSIDAVNFDKLKKRTVVWQGTWQGKTSIDLDWSGRTEFAFD